MCFILLSFPFFFLSFSMETSTPFCITVCNLLVQHFPFSMATSILRSVEFLYTPAVLFGVIGILIIIPNNENSRSSTNAKHGFETLA